MNTDFLHQEMVLDTGIIGATDFVNATGSEGTTTTSLLASQPAPRTGIETTTYTAPVLSYMPRPRIAPISNITPITYTTPRGGTETVLVQTPAVPTTTVPIVAQVPVSTIPAGYSGGYGTPSGARESEQSGSDSQQQNVAPKKKDNMAVKAVVVGALLVGAYYYFNK